MKHLMYKGFNLPYPSVVEANRPKPWRAPADITMCGSGQCSGDRFKSKCDTCLFSRSKDNLGVYSMWKRGVSKSRKVWEGMFQ